MEFYYKNSARLLAVDYFRINTPSHLFETDLNTLVTVSIIGNYVLIINFRIADKSSNCGCSSHYSMLKPAKKSDYWALYTEAATRGVQNKKSS